jgi:hypothetical protein
MKNAWWKKLVLVGLGASGMMVTTGCGESIGSWMGYTEVRSPVPPENNQPHNADLRRSGLEQESRVVKAAPTIQESSPYAYPTTSGPAAPGTGSVSVGTSQPGFPAGTPPVPTRDRFH